MQNKTRKKQKNYLIIALASLIAFSTMAASVMSGCGEKSESGNSEATNGTQIVTQIETNIVTETIAVDENGNPVKQNDKQNNKGNNSASAADSNDKNGTNNKNSSGNSSNSASASGNKSSASNANNNSAGGLSSNNSKKPDNSSSDDDYDYDNNNNEIPANADSTKYCTVNGQNYLVGDTIVCKYKLTTPKKLENFEGKINYDSKYLKVNDAILEGPAKSGSMLNYRNAGKINFNGINISSGYDYRNGDKFLTVKYKVIAPGKTTPSLNWKVACEFGSSNHNYIAKDGTPDKGFKTTVNYTRK